MKRPGSGKPAFLCLLLLLSGARESAAQAVAGPLLSLDDLRAGGSTLLNTELGSADLSVQALGSWTSSFGLAGGLILEGSGNERGVSFASSAAGLSPELLVNRVDLVLSVLLLQHFFLEASLLKDSGFREYSAGYRSDSGLLRLAEFGLRERSIPTFAGVGGGGGALHPGAQVQLESERVRAAFSAQLQPTEQQSATWIDSRRVTELVLPASNLTDRQDFLLPDAPVTGIRVFAAQSERAPSGPGETNLLGASDGRDYRELSRGTDFSVDEASGFLVLNQPAESRILVSYRNPDASGPGESGTPVPGGIPDVSNGDYRPGSLQPFVRGSALASAVARLASDDPAATGELLFAEISGEPAVLIYDPALRLPFAAYRRTDAQVPASPGETLTAEVLVRATEDGVGAPVASGGLPVRRSNGTIVLGSADPGRGPGDRLPLPSGSVPVGATDGLRALLSATEIRVVQQLPAGPIVLGPGVRSGSVRVTRNGNPESRFTVDPATGELIPGWSPAPGERIEVNWEEASDAGSASTLRLSAGTAILLPGDSGSVELGLAADLPISGTAYQPVSGATPRVLRAAGSLQSGGNRNGWDWEAGARVAGSLAGSSGSFVQLLGLDTTSLDTTISYASLGPGSAPVSGLTGFPTPTADTRAIPLAGALSNLGLPPQPLDSVPRASSQTPSAGEATGPGIARATAGQSSRLAVVLDADLAAGATWSTAQWSLGGADFSSASALELDILVQGIDAAARSDLGIAVDIGLLSEDRDSDGLLDREESDNEGGWEWDFSGTRYLHPAGGAHNGIRDSEDNNGNGALDREQRGSFVRLEFPIPADESWETAQLELDQAARELLLRAQSIRLLVQTRSEAPGLRVAVTPPRARLGLPAGQSTDSRLRLSSVPGTGPPSTLPGPAGTPEALAAASAGGALRVSWSGAEPPDSATVSLPLPGGAPLGRILGLYLQPGPGLASPSDALVLRISDASGNQLHTEVPQEIRAEEEWVDVTLSMDDGAVTYTGPDGSVVEAALLFVAAGASDPGVPPAPARTIGMPANLQLAVTSAADGSFLIDEVYAAAAETLALGNASAELRLSHRGSIARRGNTDLLWDAELSLSADAVSGSDAQGSVLAAGVVGLPGTRLGLDIGLQNGAGLQRAGASLRLAPQSSGTRANRAEMDGGIRNSWAVDGGIVAAADASLSLGEVAVAASAQTSAGPDSGNRVLNLEARAGPVQAEVGVRSTGDEGIAPESPGADLWILLSRLEGNTLAGLSSRSTEADAELRLGDEGPRFRLVPALTVFRVEMERRDYTASLDASFSLPLGSGRIFLSAGRLFSGIDGTPDPTQQSTGSDLRAAGAWMGAWTAERESQLFPGILALRPQPPGFGPEAVLRDELVLQFTRPLGRELPELLIPQVSEVGLRQSIGRDLDAFVQDSEISAGVQGATVLLRARAANRELWGGFAILQLRSGLSAGLSGPGPLASALTEPGVTELSGRILAEAEGDDGGVATIDLDGSLRAGDSPGFSGTFRAKRLFRDSARLEIGLPGSLGALSLRERHISLVAEIQSRPRDEARDARAQLDWEQRVTDGLLSSVGWTLSVAVQEARLGGSDPGSLEFGLSGRVFARISF